MNRSLIRLYAFAKTQDATSFLVYSLLHFDPQTTQVGLMQASPPGIVPLESF